MSPEKTEIRRLLRDVRAAIPHAERRAAAVALADRLGRLPELAIAGTVLVYAATAEEIDPLPAVERLRACGADIAYPRVDAPGVIVPHIVDDEAVLVSGGFGLREPRIDDPVCPLETIDAVIVPGVAFGEDCTRIGYGGGFYDRLLPRLREDCALIGIAFEQQVRATVPVEAHDALLDAVITPERVLRRPRD